MLSTTETASEPDFAARAAAFAHDTGHTPYEGPDLASTVLKQREELVRWHGDSQDPFDREWVYPGRTVIDVPGLTWPIARPEECPDDLGSGTWYDADGHPVRDVLAPGAPRGVVLLCQQCGLDLT